MTTLLPAVLVICTSALISPHEAFTPGNNKGMVSVGDFGAKGDGITDDRAAIQSAIDSLMDGGVICFPPGRYLIDSYVTSKAGDNYNLVTSHDGLTFTPCAGKSSGSVTLAQGAHGWGTGRHLAFGPIAVFNSGFFLRSFIGQNGYQNVHQNGGYYALQAPISSQSKSLTFAVRIQARAFSTGDWIAVSETTDQTVEPLEINQVVSVDYKVGTVRLRWPQTQDYRTGFAARVTQMVRSHIAINGLTLQGAAPSFLNDVFDVSITNCRLVIDTTFAGKGIYMFANSVRKMLFQDNVVTSLPTGMLASPGGMEFPQNNSIDITIDRNKIFVPAGAGEYSEHWRVTNNLFDVTGSKNPGVVFQGYDVLFEANDVVAHGRLEAAYSDNSTAPNPYGWLFSEQKVKRNHFSWSDSSGKCVVRIYSPDTDFIDNTVDGGPEQHGLCLEVSGVPRGNVPSASVKAINNIVNNTFHCSVTTAFGCVLLSGTSIEGITFKNNSVTGNGDSRYGVWVHTGQSQRSRGMLSLDDNKYIGFKTRIFTQIINQP